MPVDEKTIALYLDGLRASGATNMFGAGEYLESEFGLNKNEARDALMSWMNGFGRKRGTDSVD